MVRVRLAKICESLSCLLKFFIINVIKHCFALQDMESVESVEFFYQRDCTDYTVLLCRTSNLCNQLRFYYQRDYPDGASKARESL